MPNQKDHVEVWRWYCRVDGATGEADSREARDRDAAAHRDFDCKAHDKPVAEWVEAGHLVHVWRWSGRDDAPAQVKRWAADPAIRRELAERVE